MNASLISWYRFLPKFFSKSTIKKREKKTLTLIKKKKGEEKMIEVVVGNTQNLSNDDETQLRQQRKDINKSFMS